MESLVREGLIAGVLDITTTELADEHVGGFLSAGPERLTAAGAAGIPQVVSTGAARHGQLLRAVVSAREFKDRLFYRHNANVTLMRTTADESAAHRRGHRQEARGGARSGAVLLPARGVSAIDREGQPFDDPAARRALHDAIRAGLPEDSRDRARPAHQRSRIRGGRGAAADRNACSVERGMDGYATADLKVPDLKNGATEPTEKTEN